MNTNGPDTKPTDPREAVHQSRKERRGNLAKVRRTMKKFKKNKGRSLVLETANE